MTASFDRRRPRPYEAGPDWVVIPLGRGFTAVVSTEDEPWVREHHWSVQLDRSYDQAYACRYVSHGAFSKTKVYLHRAVVGFPCGLLVDHWNGDGLDCRKPNLRSVGRSFNGQNRYHDRQVRGVCPQGDRWGARITFLKQQIWLGTYDTIAEASTAYDEAALRYFGPGALTNARLGQGPPPLAFVVPEAIPGF